MKIFFALMLLLLLFIFPQRVGAQELDKLQIFFYEIDEAGEETLVYYHITIPLGLSVEHRALIIFSEIFDNHNPDKMLFAPPNVRILDVLFLAGSSHLILNLSSDILNFGGTHFEYKLIHKLLTNAAGIGKATYFTILIDGQNQYFPEGVLILNNSLHYFTAPESK